MSVCVVAVDVCVFMCLFSCCCYVCVCFFQVKQHFVTLKSLLPPACVHGLQFTVVFQHLRKLKERVAQLDLENTSLTRAHIERLDVPVGNTLVCIDSIFVCTLASGKKIVK